MVPDPETQPVIGLPLAVTDYRGAVAWCLDRAARRDRVYAVSAANTHLTTLARHDASFGGCMGKFDLNCPDGMPLVWAMNRRLSPDRKLRDRIYGPTLMLRTLESGRVADGFRHFLLGGTAEQLEKLQQRFAREFPESKIGGVYSPPFGAWPGDELDRIGAKIRESNSNLIWVGLGCPKQERWIADHKEALPPGVYFGVGAAFAFHAGEIAQAPAFMQRCGLEWLFRLSREPRRLFRRYVTWNSLFIVYWMKDLLTSDGK